MLSESSLCDVSIVSSGKVVPAEATFGILLFKVDGVDVSFDLKKKHWSCTCRHEGWRGAKVDRICKHIRAAQIWLALAGKVGER